MLPFIELNDSRPLIAPDLTVLRSSDYQRYLDAAELIDGAHQRASDIDAKPMRYSSSSIGLGGRSAWRWLRSSRRRCCTVCDCTVPSSIVGPTGR